MQKIPLLFKTDIQRKYVIPELNPAAAWVLEEPSIAHRKYDGTCLMRDTEDWWSRRSTKEPAKVKNFRPVVFDSLTGKHFGWEPISQSPFFKFWQEAIGQRPLDCDIIDMRESAYEFGTYELLGPKINGNPEKLKRHRLMPHAHAQQLGDIQHLELDLVEDVEVAYAELKRALFYLPVEGVVFKDRKMQRFAKLRRKDFDYTEEERAKGIQESIRSQREAMSKMLAGADNDWSASGIQLPQQGRNSNLRGLQDGGNL